MILSEWGVEILLGTYLRSCRCGVANNIETGSTSSWPGLDYESHRGSWGTGRPVKVNIDLVKTDPKYLFHISWKKQFFFNGKQSHSFSYGEISVCCSIFQKKKPEWFMKMVQQLTYWLGQRLWKTERCQIDLFWCWLQSSFVILFLLKFYLRAIDWNCLIFSTSFCLL